MKWLAFWLVVVRVGVTGMQLRPLDDSLARDADELRPRMLAMDDCSGSTRIQSMTRQLMAAHGYKYCHVDFETMKPAKNRFLKLDDSMGLGKAMVAMWKKCADNRTTYVFKGQELQMRREPDVLAQLASIGTYAVQVRRNELDQMICEVNNCFGHGHQRIGYTVDADGANTSVCFERRNLPKNETDAFRTYLNPREIMPWLRRKNESQAVLPDRLESEGLKRPKTVTYEGLAAYQYPEGTQDDRGNDFASSLADWTTLLTSLGVKVDVPKVDAYLRGGVGTRMPPRPHSEILLNPWHIRRALHEVNLGALFRNDERDNRTHPGA